MFQYSRVADLDSVQPGKEEVKIKPGHVQYDSLCTTVYTTVLDTSVSTTVYVQQSMYNSLYNSLCTTVYVQQSVQQSVYNSLYNSLYMYNSLYNSLCTTVYTTVSDTSVYTTVYATAVYTTVYDILVYTTVYGTTVYKSVYRTQNSGKLRLPHRCVIRYNAPEIKSVEISGQYSVSQYRAGITSYNRNTVSFIIFPCGFLDPVFTYPVNFHHQNNPTQTTI